MSPRFDEVFGTGALCALESDLAHPVLGTCCATEHPDAFIPQAPRGAAVVDLAWADGGRASVATSPGFWFFSWLDAGETRGAGLIAHLARVLVEVWGVVEARCLAVDYQAASILSHCGFRPWAEGPAVERHLLTITASDVAPYVRSRDAVMKTGRRDRRVQTRPRGSDPCNPDTGIERI